MCVLCVIQRWSRRLVTILPWFVLPFIGIWVFSQLLPPPFRYETTYPRLAALFVILVCLCWDRFLFPQLTDWRARRNARLRVRKRFEAIELQKLRKTATRMCRNCQTPYKDQNPGGGKFMCSYCGHNSKRPVLDLPGPRVPNSGIIKDLVGKGGKILNGKGWSENGWMCGQDWLENANWVSRSVAGKPSYWGKNGSGVFGGEEDCLAEKSYSGVVILACKLLMTTLFLNIRWFLRKIFQVSSLTDDALFDSDHREVNKRGENGTSFNENRAEKARRKAEERRQARLEKELLEEEERKQREEVARLVDERRRLRDGKLEAEKDRSKFSAPAREKEMKKDAEKKRQERKKEKDKVSSKSNSDAEEVEKRAGKETDRKRYIVKKSEIDWRDYQKSGTDNAKCHTLETGYGMKSNSNNFSRGNAGTRYFDRMGTIFSASKALSGSSFFGKSSNNPITVIKENKTNNFVDHVNTSAHRKGFCSSESVSVKFSLNEDDKNVKTNNPVLSDPQPRAATKSWQQLFTTSSSSVPPISNPNVISRPNSKIQAEPQSLPLLGHSTIQTFDNPISFGLPSPFISRIPNGAPGSSLGFSPSIEPIFTHAGEGLHEFTPEEPEPFEDPCYVPDIMSSLLGPISESLDNFQSNLDAGFGTDMGIEKPRALKNLSDSFEINKPSPIESPLSRLRSIEERYNNSNRFLSNPKAQDLHNFHVNATNASEEKEWQMWNNSPLHQDGPGLVGGPASWLLPRERNRSSKEVFVIPTKKTMASFFTKEDHIPGVTHSPPNAFLGSSQDSGPSSPVIGLSDHDPWLQNAVIPPLAGSDNHFPIKCEEEMSETSHGSPSESASIHPFEPSPVNCWPKKESAMHTSGEAAGWPHVGGLFSTLDVQPPW